jgi:hypothetical protein
LKHLLQVTTAWQEPLKPNPNSQPSVFAPQAPSHLLKLIVVAIILIIALILRQGRAWQGLGR